MTEERFIRGFIVVEGKECEFIAKFDKALFNALLLNKDVKFKDISKLVFEKIEGN